MKKGREKEEEEEGKGRRRRISMRRKRRARWRRRARGRRQCEGGRTLCPALAPPPPPSLSGAALKTALITPANVISSAMKRLAIMKSDAAHRQR